MLEKTFPHNMRCMFLPAGKVFFYVLTVLILSQNNIYSQEGTGSGAAAPSGDAFTATTNSANTTAKTAGQQQQQSQQYQGQAEQAEADGNAGAAAQLMDMSDYFDQLSKMNFAKADAGREMANTGRGLYSSSMSMDPGGSSLGGGGGYYDSPTVTAPLPIDDYLKGVREVAGMQPPDYKTMADIHNNENLPPLALRDTPLEQMYSEPPQANPPMLADPMNPAYSNVQPENPLNNPLTNPALLAGNNAPLASAAASPTASTSGNAHQTPIITVSATPQHIANVEEKPSLGVIAPVIASDINDTLELIYPFDDPRLTDSDIKPVVLSYNRITDTDMDFYDSLDATLITRNGPSTYYQEADGEVYEVTNNGDVVSTTPGIFLADLESTPAALNNQVKFDTRSDTEVAQSFEIDENPVRAYLIRLFGNLNDVSINQTAFDDSRGYRMEVYFVMVHKAGYKNMMIYVHNNHIIGVKFIDRQNTISSVPVYVQMPNESRVSAMAAARMQTIFSTLDSLEIDKAIVETPVLLAQPIRLEDTQLTRPAVSEPVIPEIPSKPVIADPATLNMTSEKPKVITPLAVSPDISIPKNIATSEGSKLLGNKQEFKPSLPATGNASILNQLESQPINSRPFMLF